MLRDTERHAERECALLSFSFFNCFRFLPLLLSLFLFLSSRNGDFNGNFVEAEKQLPHDFSLSILPFLLLYEHSVHSSQQKFVHPSTEGPISWKETCER